MKTSTLNLTFLALIVLTLIVLAVMFVVNSMEEESEFNGFKEITGAAQTFEVLHEKPSYASELYQDLLRVDQTERYNEKYFSYLMSKQESRRETFFR